MNKNEILSVTPEQAKTGSRLAAFSAIATLALLVVTATMAPGGSGRTVVMLPAAFAVALLFSIAAWVHSILLGNAVDEEEEKRILAARRADRMLDVEEDVRFSAKRSLDNYRKFAPYVVALLAAVCLGVLLYTGWSRLAEYKYSADPTRSALLLAVTAVFTLFCGIFYTGQSSAGKAFRWLRPAGAWMTFSAMLLLVALVGSICRISNLTGFDETAADVVLVLMAILAAELPIDALIEFYRPRGGESRPVFESRILAIFTEGGGLMRNFASALDYQFGFKVSGTWIYGFLERAFIPVALVWILFFWGFTCIHEVGPDEIGFRTMFGTATKEDLSSGIYLSLPWPFGSVVKVNCAKLHQTFAGEDEKDTKDDIAREVVSWTQAHGKDTDNYLAAVKEAGTDGDSSTVAYVRLSVPVQYRIRRDGARRYAFDHADCDKLIRLMSERVLSGFLANSEMDGVMSDGRAEAELKMKKRLQEMVDEAGLGVEVVSISVLDVHPPTGGDKDVAKAYEDVIGSMEQKETSILEAQAYSAKTGPAAKAESEKVILEAKAYEARQKTIAGAESERFVSRLASFRAMPAMFRLNSYLDILENDTAELRKYIVSSGLKDEIYELNLEENARLDLLDADFSKLKKEDK
ncbi:MAG: protease modulator HflK [Victivallaceae bacterium]|nr:protease modulator HflK [Victivallaceae bacterium]